MFVEKMTGPIPFLDTFRGEIDPAQRTESLRREHFRKGRSME
jgi:hypothetical protein